MRIDAPTPRALTLAALVAAIATGSASAQTLTLPPSIPAPEATRVEIAHALEMAIGGIELGNLAKLPGQASDQLRQQAQSQLQEASRLLQDAYSTVEANPGSSPVQKFYSVSADYTKALIALKDNPQADPTLVTLINEAIKGLLTAEDLLQEAKGLSGPTAQRLQQHAESMKSNSQQTLGQVRMMVAPGSPAQTLLTHADQVNLALQQLSP